MPGRAFQATQIRSSLPKFLWSSPAQSTHLNFDLLMDYRLDGLWIILTYLWSSAAQSSHLNFDLILWIDTRCVKRNANVVFWKTTTHNICCEVIILAVGVVEEDLRLSGTFCLLYSPGSLTLPGTRSLPSMFCLLYLGWA